MAPPYFLDQMRRLGKKFTRIEMDLEEFRKSSTISGGVSLGKWLYKFRLKNSSIPTGRRSGFRVIGLLLDTDTILLVTIYSKSEVENITIREIENILALL